MSVRLYLASFLTLTTVVTAGRVQSITTAPLFQDVQVAGDRGYHTYRIPSVIATPWGTLLAFAEGRKAGAADAGDIDLVIRRSSDAGVSWSPIRVLWDDGPNAAARYGSAASTANQRRSSEEPKVNYSPADYVYQSRTTSQRGHT